MSWVSAPQRKFLLLAVLSALIPLSGCGYTPLYGSMDHDSKVTEAMQQVSVPTIGGGLVGLDVRNELLDSLGIEGSPIHPAQRLEVTVTPGLAGLLVQPDAAITRYNYTLVGSYKLVDSSSGKVLTQGSVYGESAYNVVASQYATVVARRDAEKRAAQNVSEEIATRVAVYFKQ